MACNHNMLDCAPALLDPCLPDRLCLCDAAGSVMEDLGRAILAKTPKQEPHRPQKRRTGFALSLCSWFDLTTAVRVTNLEVPPNIPR
jgi:hypothetical protein